MSESDSVLFNVDINNYNGPLDVLLDLAKAQKVDLEEISITKLADQFHDYITSEKDLNLEIASEYLFCPTKALAFIICASKELGSNST